MVLTDMHAKRGEIAAATEVFDALPERNVLTISGHAQNDQSEGASRLVTEGDNEPNGLTVMAVLSA